MNKGILMFVVGLAAGAVGGVVATKEYWRKKYNEIADAEIDEMQKYYDKKCDELVNFFEDETVNPIDESENGDKEKSENKMDQNKAAEIKEKLTRNHEQTTNYAKMYSSDEIPDEDDENAKKAEFEETGDEDAEEYTEDHSRNINRAPKIISEDSLGDLPGYIDTKVLFFYTLDDVLTTEEDELIEEREALGDCLDKFNFRESDEKIIFVRNYAMDVVYEVHKIPYAYNSGPEEQY